MQKMIILSKHLIAAYVRNNLIYASLSRSAFEMISSSWNGHFFILSCKSISITINISLPHSKACKYLLILHGTFVNLHPTLLAAVPVCFGPHNDLAILLSSCTDICIVSKLLFMSQTNYICN